LVVDGDVEEAVEYYRGGVGKGYEIFAPSHPQAVNQYVREYNYYADEPQPDYDYEDAVKQYQQAVARKYCITAYLNDTDRAGCLLSDVKNRNVIVRKVTHSVLNGISVRSDEVLVTQWHKPLRGSAHGLRGYQAPEVRSLNPGPGGRRLVDAYRSTKCIFRE